MSNQIHGVNLSYGQVGHSHGLCDAGFGAISTILRKKQNVTNYEDFANLLNNLTFENIVGDAVHAEEVEILTTIYDWYVFTEKKTFKQEPFFSNFIE